MLILSKLSWGTYANAYVIIIDNKLCTMLRFHNDYSAECTVVLYALCRVTFWKYFEISMQCTHAHIVKFTHQHNAAQTVQAYSTLEMVHFSHNIIGILAIQYMLLMRMMNIICPEIMCSYRIWLALFYLSYDTIKCYIRNNNNIQIVGYCVDTIC